MVARAWPVSVEVIQDWLLAAPSQTSPPSCFYWRFSTAWYGTVRHGSVRYGTAQFGSVCISTAV